MRLKDYQREALERLVRFAGEVASARTKFDELAILLENADADVRGPALASAMPATKAWSAMQKAGDCASSNTWLSLKDGWGHDIPHVCLEMPTGSGKTLVAGHAIGRTLAALDKVRTGFVLWIVPSEAIYKQTLRQLRDRGSAVRAALDTASGGAVKILEKGDGFTANDVENQLCVMIMMLQSAGRLSARCLSAFATAT